MLEKLRKVMRETGRKGLPASAPPAEEARRRPAHGHGRHGRRWAAAWARSVPPAAHRLAADPALALASQQPDLLQGVQEMNKGFQGKQSEKLQKMYEGGQGGVGAGMF